MSLLLISNILLWVGLATMSLIVLALARQIGVLHERIAPAGALALNSRLTPGAAAPMLSLRALDGRVLEIGGPRASLRSQLLFFVSPDCPVCKSLLPVLKSAAQAEGAWLDVALASDGEEQPHAAYVATHGLEPFAYVVSRELGQRYGVSKLPYACLIDETGRIAALGIVNSREHLESLFEAKERKVASIQDYFARRASGSIPR
ncbi:MAG: methylamine dehydrogenase [Panacagrimonas sp.]